LNLGYFFENGNSVFKFQGDFKGWGIIWGSLACPYWRHPGPCAWSEGLNGSARKLFRGLTRAEFAVC
jgi:hypothetical protein